MSCWRGECMVCPPGKWEREVNKKCDDRIGYKNSKGENSVTDDYRWVMYVCVFQKVTTGIQILFVCCKFKKSI